MGHMKKLGKLDHLFFTLTNFKYSYQFPSSLVHIILQNHEAHVCVLWEKSVGMITVCLLVKWQVLMDMHLYIIICTKFKSRLETQIDSSPIFYFLVGVKCDGRSNNFHLLIVRAHASPSSTSHIGNFTLFWRPQNTINEKKIVNFTGFEDDASYNYFTLFSLMITNYSYQNDILVKEWINWKENPNAPEVKKIV